MLCKYSIPARPHCTNDRPTDDSMLHGWVDRSRLCGFACMASPSRSRSRRMTRSDSIGLRLDRLVACMSPANDPMALAGSRRSMKARLIYIACMCACLLWVHRYRGSACEYTSDTRPAMRTARSSQIKAYIALVVRPSA